jgi:adenylosuccinate lyase
MQELSNISPIDGRYASKTQSLIPYFSEFGLIKFRVWIEVEYIIELNSLDLGWDYQLTNQDVQSLRHLVNNFSLVQAQEIKEIEKTTNHDVKAVEYFLKSFITQEIPNFNLEFIHFGLTSQDINNTAIPLSIKKFLEDQYFPSLKSLVQHIEKHAIDYLNIPMLARTHGQPASPVRLGKEFEVFVERLNRQISMMESIPMGAKFGGATGGFNAHKVAYPNINWVDFGNRFVENNLGLTRYQKTTQIEHYDYLAALLDNAKRINTILIDFSRDIWQYISMEYFKQKVIANEVGSSAMPHKVNPIDFENAEGNLGMANAVFEFLSSKLPISRLQRDLTDSTVLRNIGVPFSHTEIAISSLNKGLSKLLVNPMAMEKDLDENWAVVAEGIQTILRRENFPKPYEALKELTRGGIINQESIQKFIKNLPVTEEIKEELSQITPHNYTGY